METGRYYFHLTDGEHTLVDHEGLDLNSVAAAFEHASEHGPAVVQNLRAVVDVTNGSGTSLVKVPLVLLAQAAAFGSQRDTLTGLAGRAVFIQQLRRAICTLEAGSSVGLLLIDLDRMKDTNDAFGYGGGDALLQHVATTLQKQGNEHVSLVARLDGDKFAVILHHMQTAQDAVALAATIQGALSEPWEYGGMLLSHSASAGLALSSDPDQESTDLVSNADIALREAKATGSGCLVIYADAMKSHQRRHFEAIALARSALAEARLVPYYQPKVSLMTGKIIGFEALLRVERSKTQISPPAKIADALDHPELAVSIGRVMQEQVFDQIQAWMASGTKFGNIALNASPTELLLSSYAEGVLGRLASRKIPPELLQIEVTETAMTGRGANKLADEFGKLRAHGVSVFLDDFGTGYASLVHLRDFPVNGIKIDRSFVAGAGKDPDAGAIATVLIELARKLKLQLVAEGIETKAQADFLASAGCEVAQGYLYSEAMPGSTVRAFLSNWNNAGRQPASRPRQAVGA